MTARREYSSVPKTTDQRIEAFARKKLGKRFSQKAARASALRLLEESATRNAARRGSLRARVGNVR
jgi:hypothetical protein